MKCKILYILFFLLSTSFTHFIFGQDMDATILELNLEDAFAVGIKNNFDVKSQEISVEIAKSQVKQTKAMGLPQINASGNYQYTILNSFAERTSSDETNATVPPLLGNYQHLTVDQQGDVQGIAFESIGGFFANIGNAFASKHQMSGAVGVNQLVFDGVYLLGLKAAEVYVNLSEVQIEPTKRDLEVQIEKAYYGVLITNESIGIVNRNITNVEKLLYETEKTYEAGFVEQLDIDRLELSLSILENQKRNLEQLYRFNMDVFKNAINVPLSTEVDLTDSLNQFAEFVFSDQILEDIATPEQWAEFKILDVQEQIQNLDIERVKKERLPKLNAFANGNYGFQGNEFSFREGWYPNLVAGLSMSFPIFDGNLKKNQIIQKQLEIEQTQINREALQTNINLQIQNSMTSYFTAKNSVETQIENVELAQKIYNTTQVKYKEGVGSSVEVIQAQQELYSAQQAYINALYDLLLAKVDLQKALGKY